MIDVIIPYFNIFFSISMSCCDFHSYLFFRKIQSRVKRKKYIQKSRIVRDPIRKVNHLNLCLMFHILFFFFLCHRIKVNSCIFCFWPISLLWLPLLDLDAFEFYNFFILVENQWLNPWKISPNGKSPLWKFQIIIWDFPNRAPPESPFSSIQLTYLTIIIANCSK